LVVLKRLFILAFLVTLGTLGQVAAQEKKGAQDSARPKGPPPTLVAVAPVTTGSTEPMTEFVGTVYYARVSEVAAEIEGRVDVVSFEEGRRVEAEQELVRLNTDLLDMTIEGSRETYEQVLVDLEEAEKSLKRIDPLYQEGSVAEVVFDEHHFKKKRLERSAAVLKIALERQLLEKKKKTILSPFAGIVMKKSVEKGEWVPEGGTVAVVADDGEIDVVVDIPGDLLQHLREGRKIDITCAGKSLKARFVSFVPKGDIATRTFSVKLRLENSAGLVEGMEARATMPTDRKTSGLVVPRDAVIDKHGRTVVFAVRDGAAAMIPVTVTGHDGLRTGVSGPGLEEGLSVVVKGNERLRDGQPVRTAQ
jgi:RND family efflux transporter MFP subunit